MIAIQDGHAERRKSDEEYKWEDDSIELNGVAPRGWIAAHHREQTDNLGREDHSQHGDDGENYGERPEQTIGEVPDFFVGLLHLIGTEHGDEGRGQCAFGYEPAKQVRNAKRQEEGVGKNAGAEKQSDALVPDIAQETACQSRQCDDRRGLENLFFFGQSWRAPER